MGVFIDNISNELNAISVGRKHEEIMMKWVDAQDEAIRSQELWDSLQKEYQDFEDTVYPKMKQLIEKRKIK